jgi:hypothetical protein
VNHPGAPTRCSAGESGRPSAAWPEQAPPSRRAAGSPRSAARERRSPAPRGRHARWRWPAGRRSRAPPLPAPAGRGSRTRARRRPAARRRAVARARRKRRGDEVAGAAPADEGAGIAPAVGRHQALRERDHPGRSETSTRLSCPRASARLADGTARKITSGRWNWSSRAPRAHLELLGQFDARQVALVLARLRHLSRLLLGAAEKCGPHTRPNEQERHRGTERPGTDHGCAAGMLAGVANWRDATSDAPTVSDAGSPGGGAPAGGITGT